MIILCEYCDLRYACYDEWLEHLLTSGHQEIIGNAIEYWEESLNERSLIVTINGSKPGRDEICFHFANFGLVSDAFFEPDLEFCVIQLDKKDYAVNALALKHSLENTDTELRLQLKSEISLEEWTKLKQKSFDDLENNEFEEKHLKIVTMLKELPVDGQMEHFEQENTITKEELTLRRRLVKDINKIFSKEYPKCILCPYGSLVTCLGSNSSFIDVYFNATGLEEGKVNPSTLSHEDIMSSLAKLIHYSNVEDLFFRDLHVFQNEGIPYMTFTHQNSNTKFKLTLKSLLPVRSSKLLAFVMKLDARLPFLFVIVHYWGKYYKLTGSQRMTSYSLNLLLLTFLTMKKIVPSVTVLKIMGNASKVIDGWETAFCDELDRIQSVMSFLGGDASSFPKNPVTGKPTALAVLQLAGEFFSMYAHSNLQCLVVCSAIGELVPRSTFDKGTITSLPKGLEEYTKHIVTNNVRLNTKTVLCIQDPFDLACNAASDCDISEEFILRFQFICADTCEDIEKLLNSSLKPNLMDIFRIAPKEEEVLVATPQIISELTEKKILPQTETLKMCEKKESTKKLEWKGVESAESILAMCDQFLKNQNKAKTKKRQPLSKNSVPKKKTDITAGKVAFVQGEDLRTIIPEKKSNFSHHLTNYYMDSPSVNTPAPTSNLVGPGPQPQTNSASIIPAHAPYFAGAVPQPVPAPDQNFGYYATQGCPPPGPQNVHQSTPPVNIPPPMSYNIGPGPPLQPSSAPIQHLGYSNQVYPPPAPQNVYQHPPPPVQHPPPTHRPSFTPPRLQHSNNYNNPPFQKPPAAVRAPGPQNDSNSQYFTEPSKVSRYPEEYPAVDNVFRTQPPQYQPRMPKIPPFMNFGPRPRVSANIPPFMNLSPPGIFASRSRFLVPMPSKSSFTFTKAGNEPIDPCPSLNLSENSKEALPICTKPITYGDYERTVIYPPDEGFSRLFTEHFGNLVGEETLNCHMKVLWCMFLKDFLTEVWSKGFRFQVEGIPYREIAKISTPNSSKTVAEYNKFKNRSVVPINAEENSGGPPDPKKPKGDSEDANEEEEKESPITFAFLLPHQNPCKQKFFDLQVLFEHCKAFLCSVKYYFTNNRRGIRNSVFRESRELLGKYLDPLELEGLVSSQVSSANANITSEGNFYEFVAKISLDSSKEECVLLTIREVKNSTGKQSTAVINSTQHILSVFKDLIPNYSIYRLKMWLDPLGTTSP